MKMIEVTRDAVVERGPRYKLIDGREVNPRRLLFVGEAVGMVATEQVLLPPQAEQQAVSFVLEQASVEVSE